MKRILEYFIDFSLFNQIGSFLVKYEFELLSGHWTFVPTLILGSFLTLSVRNGHTLKDYGFSILARIISKIQ